MNEPTTTAPNQEQPICANPACKKNFTKKKKWQKFCTPACSNKIRMDRYWHKRLNVPA